MNKSLLNENYFLASIYNNRACILVNSRYTPNIKLTGMVFVMSPICIQDMSVNFKLLTFLKLSFNILRG